MPFESIQYGQNLNPNGTGLCLSICKRILNEIDCSIELQESWTEGPNKGSLFSFRIPMKKSYYKKKGKVDAVANRKLNNERN